MTALRYDCIRTYTGMAVLFVFDMEEVWLPSSQINNFDDLDFTGKGGGVVELRSWLVAEHSLEGYEVG